LVQGLTDTFYTVLNQATCNSLTSHVGAGSNWHVLHSAEPSNLSTSSTDTAVHSSNVGTILCGTSYDGVVEVDKRTDSTLSLKKVGKSCGVLTLTSSPPWSLSTPFNVRQSLLMLPLLAAISSCQYMVFLFSYSICILLSSSDQSRLSSSEQVRRKRLSSTLARHRAARHSALNHSVDGLCLHCTVTDGRWRSNSSVITRLYMSTRSSADTHLSELRLQQSVDAAKSEAKASWSNRRQAVRDTLRTVSIFFFMHNLK